MNLSELDLDAKGFDVYEAIYEHGGEATTTDIKQYTGIEKNAIVHYRLDKLEDQGVIEIGVGEASGGRTPPKLAILTDIGKKLGDERLFDEAEPTILERTDRVERRMKAVEAEFHALSDEFRKWRYDDENDREVDITDVLEKLTKFEEMTEGVDDDALEDALAVTERVEDVEAALTVRGKHYGYIRSLPGSGSKGTRMVEGADVVGALNQLEGEINMIVEALTENDIEVRRVEVPGEKEENA